MAKTLLKNESIIGRLWEEFSVENGQFKVTPLLKIFKHIFEEPLQNIDKFIELSEALCGNGRCPRALKFYEKVLIGIQESSSQVATQFSSFDRESIFLLENTFRRTFDLLINFSNQTIDNES